MIINVIFNKIRTETLSGIDDKIIYLFVYLHAIYNTRLFCVFEI